MRAMLSDDITLCPGQGCPIRDRCLRYRLVRPGGRFDAFGRPPWDPAAARCDQFEDIERLMPTEADIRRRAYFIWERNGRPSGRELEHWEAARAELVGAVQGTLRPID